jgi:hypothetical protein
MESEYQTISVIIVFSWRLELSAPVAHGTHGTANGPGRGCTELVIDEDMEPSGPGSIKGI